MVASQLAYCRVGRICIIDLGSLNLLALPIVVPGSVVAVKTLRCA